MRVRTNWPRRHYALREGDLRRLRLHHRLPHCAADVLDALVCMDIPDARGLRKGFCWPSMERLRVECGHNCVRTTQRGKAALVAAGLIEVYRLPGRGHTDLYVLRWDRIAPGGPGPKGDTDPWVVRGERVTAWSDRNRRKDLKPAAPAADASSTTKPPAQRPPECMTDPSQRARWMAEQVAAMG